MGDGALPLEQRQLELQVKKLEFEIEDLRSNLVWERRFARYTPLLSMVLAVLGFGFGVLQFRLQQQDAIIAIERQTNADSKRALREFMQPILAKQIQIYFDASEAAATIARTQDPKARAKAVDTFWRLYQGPLVMLESQDVSGAMKRFGDCLSNEPACSGAQLRDLSLSLATAFQKDMTSSWELSPTQFTERSFQYERR